MMMMHVNKAASADGSRTAISLIQNNFIENT